jgi:hypothetical protein
MLKALPSVVMDPVVRKETEKLVKGLPDTRMLQAITNRQGAAPKAPKYPLPPYVKWLLGSLGSIMACTGTSSGVLLCSMLTESTGNFATHAGCHQGGMMHIGGSCGVMMGRLMQVCAKSEMDETENTLISAIDKVLSFGKKMITKVILAIGYTYKKKSQSWSRAIL